jgi:pimeloyl-ACP methyl ester carboxylesterase
VKGSVPGLPRMILVHGFGGGGPVFCKMMAHLSQYFEVTTIDLLGLAGSGRPHYEAFDY